MPNKLIGKVLSLLLVSHRSCWYVERRKVFTRKNFLSANEQKTVDTLPIRIDIVRSDDSDNGN